MTTALLVVTLQLVNVPQAFGDDGALVVNTASDFPLAGVDPSEATSPSAVYAGMLWSITDSRVNTAEGLLERASVEVDATLTNTLATSQIRVPDSMVSLVARTGEEVTDGRFVDAGARLALEPGESQDVTIRFEVGYDQTPRLRDLSLQIAEPNRVAASISLAGNQPDHDFPIFAAVDTAPATLGDPDNAERQIVMEPTAASIDINAGPYRAAFGEQLAVVKVSVQRAEANDEAGFLDTAYWTLVADGEATPAILVTKTSEPSSNTDEVTLLFAFAEGADDLSVMAGANTDGPADFAVVLPS